MELESILQMTGAELKKHLSAAEQIVQYAVPLGSGPIPYNQRLPNYVTDSKQWCLFEPNSHTGGIKRLLLAVQNGKAIEHGQLKCNQVQYAFTGCLSDIENIVGAYNKFLP